MVRLGIETVYQDLALCDNLDVVANLYLGRELRARRVIVLSPVDEITMEKRTIDVLHSLAVTLPDVHVKIAALSSGQRQSVAVARAVMWNSRIVMLDEPTAALSVAQTRQVLELIRRLRHQGLGIVVISHNLAEIFEVCDRIVEVGTHRLQQKTEQYGIEVEAEQGVEEKCPGIGEISAHVSSLVIQ